MHFLSFYSEDKNKDQAMTNITEKVFTDIRIF